MFGAVVGFFRHPIQTGRALLHREEVLDKMRKQYFEQQLSEVKRKYPRSNWQVNLLENGRFCIKNTLLISDTRIEALVMTIVVNAYCETRFPKMSLMEKYTLYLEAANAVFGGTWEDFCKEKLNATDANSDWTSYESTTGGESFTLKYPKGIRGIIEGFAGKFDRKGGEIEPLCEKVGYSVDDIGSRYIKY